VGQQERVLATAVDALVRSATISFVIDGVSMKVGEDVVLEAGVDEGRWLLPAFMAGMRDFGACADATAADMRRLAAELAALEH